MMKKVKYITGWLILCGILAGMTGCGPVNTAGDSASSVSGSAVSGGSVSESAVSESAVAVVSTDRDVERNRFANHNNIYTITYDSSAEDEPGENEILTQMKPDGTVVQEYDIKDLDGVAWVTDEWVYYVTEERTLWRAPIERTERGDRLKPDQAERLLQEEFLDWRNVYVADTGIFYIADQEGVISELRKYDFQKKESVRLKKTEGYMWIRLDHEAREDNPIMLGDSLFIQHDSELYTLDTVNAGLKKIYKGMNDQFRDNIVACGDSICFVPDCNEAQVYRYDGEKVECVIKKDVLRGKIFDLGYPTGGATPIEKIFIYKDRMYFYVPVISGHDDGGYWYYKAQLLLSAPVNDLLNMRGDDKFFHYMSDHGNISVRYDHVEEEERALKVGDEYFYDSPLTSVDGGWDGKLILEGRFFASKSGTGYYPYSYAIYDLDTGEIEETEAAKALQNKDVEALKEAFKKSASPRDSAAAFWVGLE